MGTCREAELQLVKQSSDNRPCVCVYVYVCARAACVRVLHRLVASKVTYHRVEAARSMSLETGCALREEMDSLTSGLRLKSTDLMQATCWH